MDLITIKNFMQKFGMSHTALASHLGMSSVLLTNKLNPKYRNKINNKDVEGIRAYFQNLQTELETLLAGDIKPAAPAAPAVVVEEPVVVVETPAPLVKQKVKTPVVVEGARARKQREKQEVSARCRDENLADPFHYVQYSGDIPLATNKTLERHPHLRALLKMKGGKTFYNFVPNEDDKQRTLSQLKGNL